GLRTDPITQQVSTVPADFGRALKDPTGKITGVTSVTVGGGITGMLVSRGNLVSTVTSKSVSGSIDVQGDLGVIQTDALGNAVLTNNQLTRFAGVTVSGSGSGFGGDLVILGNDFGDITISGGMTGRMAAKGRPVQGLASTRTGFLGNVSISGAIAASGALVSAGMIGDQAGGTGLTIGSVQGIIA